MVKKVLKYFEEDHRSQARLLVFEILCGANESLIFHLGKNLT